MIGFNPFTQSDPIASPPPPTTTGGSGGGGGGSGGGGGTGGTTDPDPGGGGGGSDDYVQVDSFEVDSTSGSTVSSNVTLEQGVSYYVEVDGTVQIDKNGREADAVSYQHSLGGDFESSSGQKPHLVADSSGGTWTPADDGDHSYGMYITGDGSPLQVHFADNPYSDNSGSLHLLVSEKRFTKIVVGHTVQAKAHAWRIAPSKAGNNGETTSNVSEEEDPNNRGTIVVNYDGADITIQDDTADKPGTYGHEQKHILAINQAIAAIVARLNGTEFTQADVDAAIKQMLDDDTNHLLPGDPAADEKDPPIDGIFPDPTMP